MLIVTALLSLGTFAQVQLNSAGRDAAYVKTILGRSQEIVDQLGLTDASAKENVLHIIANRYFLLNDIHGGYSAEVARIKKDAAIDQAARQRMQGDLQNARDAKLYQHHFELESALANYLTEKQIEQVKDGMTYGVVMVTYRAQLDMIPTLKPEEKTQILAWLKEAREYAMDAGDSKSKHAWFGKYKGRINNWLSQRGYDLTKERQEWQQRIKARKAE